MNASVIENELCELLKLSKNDYILIYIVIHSIKKENCTVLKSGVNTFIDLLKIDKEIGFLILNKPINHKITLGNLL